MNRPIVTAVAQIGVIVADADAAVARYQGLLGLGDWEFASVPDEAGTVMARIAWTTLGDVELELIEPRTEAGIYADFLKTSGPGLHHVMFATPDYDRFAEHMREQGVTALRSGELQHTRFRLFETESDLGLIVEIVEGGALEPDGLQ